MNYDKLTELCRKRAVFKDQIEHDMYSDCGPDSNDYRELEITETEIEGEESNIIIEYYKTAIGDMCFRLEKSQADCRERYDEIKVLKHILDHQGLKWRDHQLFEEHMKKRRENYFDKEENK